MIFWIILILIIIDHLVKKRENTVYLNLAFYIFIFGALLYIVTLKEFSEFFMRISFIFFLIGLVLSYLGGGGTIKPK
ncbi:MAG: hypothetical protein Q7R43_02475 [Candidatus Daviesbacteria bacterium]|nr:hypothetical protein [Candidatus Daviesbacteria bacterium]